MWACWLVLVENLLYLEKIVCEKATQENVFSKDCEKRNGKGNATNLLPK